MVFHVLSQLTKQAINSHRSETHISCNSTLKNTTEPRSNACFLEDVSEVLLELDDDYLRNSDDEHDM